MHCRRCGTGPVALVSLAALLACQTSTSSTQASDPDTSANAFSTTHGHGGVTAATDQAEEGITAAGSTAHADGTTAGSDGDDNPCNDSPEALADCADPQAYAEDLVFVAELRAPGTPHWQAVQDHCADRLEMYGYNVELHTYDTGVNVIGRKPGGLHPEQEVYVAAHYDHLEECHGADDNASGVAATLEIARMLAQADYERTLVIACWDEEEEGLVGSKAYMERFSSRDDGTQVVGVFNFDLIAFTSSAPNSQRVPDGFDSVFGQAYGELQTRDFRGDFIAVIDNSLAHQTGVDFVSQATRIDLPAILIEIPEGAESSDLFADLRRSDHAPFWDAGAPALFITDTANFRNDHYHCVGGPDEVEDLDQPFAVKVTRATIGAAAMTLGMR